MRGQLLASAVVAAALLVGLVAASSSGFYNVWRAKLPETYLWMYPSRFHQDIVALLGASNKVVIASAKVPPTILATITLPQPDPGNHQNAAEFGVDKLFISTVNGVKAYALNGTLLWDYNVNYNAHTPRYHNGFVYYICAYGNLHQLNASTGVQTWLFKPQALKFRMQPTVGGSDRLILLTTDHTLAAVDISAEPTGLLWERKDIDPLNRQAWATIGVVLTNDRLIIMDTNNTLHSLDPASGKSHWQQSLQWPNLGVYNSNINFGAPFHAGPIYAYNGDNISALDQRTGAITSSHPVQSDEVNEIVTNAYAGCVSVGGHGMVGLYDFRGKYYGSVQVAADQHTRIYQAATGAVEPGAFTPKFMYFLTAEPSLAIMEVA